MSVAEKLQKVAENVSKVYMSGAEDFGLKGSGQGELVHFENVHPIEHKVEVGLSSKNLFNDAAANITETDDYFTSNVGYSKDAFYSLAVEPGETYVLTFMIRTEIEHVWGAELGVGIGSLPTYGTGRIALSLITQQSYQNFVSSRISFTVPADVEKVYFQTNTEYKFKNFQIEKASVPTAYTPHITDFTDTLVKVTGKNLLDMNNYRIWPDYGLGVKLDNLIEGQTYAFSTNIPIKQMKVSNAPGGYTCSGSKNVDSGFVKHSWVHKRAEQLSPTTPIYLFIIPVGETGFIKNIADFEGYQLQIEVGETQTEYETYNEASAEYTAAADGTVSGVKSISPDMTLFADTEGVTVSAECFLDPEAVINELSTAIISLGGEI